MLRGRGRDPRTATAVPAHLAARAQQVLPTSSARPPPPQHRSPLAKPEPDYEVVEFPSDQYVNAKLQPPPPPPPRPPTGKDYSDSKCHVICLLLNEYNFYKYNKGGMVCKWPPQMTSDSCKNCQICLVSSSPHCKCIETAHSYDQEIG